MIAVRRRLHRSLADCHLVDRPLNATFLSWIQPANSTASTITLYCSEAPLDRY
jgi:hypothetical protein